ncbi:MAG: hypothetical protein JGK12_02345 [Microcoleus sp. PH2017_01_SCD_O_A]|nr:hypothetical protein [Microcoleus sp. PH2017_01_SCD_O_A]MCC3421286.1 hypothetical protein [Microcoleus sp. PH2017_07_MST_O_A]MCC3422777.1 hypothetical protein [Microcoleus sp. PH2017_01_SCD_O_A]
MAIGLNGDRPHDTAVPASPLAIDSRAGTLALHRENYYSDRSGNDII